MHVIATAGHVDHGKSTLVRALTGMEPDRLAEERDRAMSIDLGYAWTRLRSGEDMAFVDVPGHEHFASNMLAGVGPVPAVMLVIAADAGWSTQTEEHVTALDALRIPDGVVAVTRSDLADPGPALMEATGRLSRTSLAGIPSMAVSALTGDGLDQLRDALDSLAARLPGPDPSARVRLWLDRAFTIRGAGTVVTGTLVAGTVRRGDVLELNGRTVTVRGIECLGTPVGTVSGTARVALNLRGIGHYEVRRGQSLLSPGRWRPTHDLDVRIDNAVRASHLVVHVGSAGVPACVRVLPGGEQAGTVIARLRLDSSLPLEVGDRLVLRDPGVRCVLGGATVLDPAPPDLGRRGAARNRAAALRDDLGRPDLEREVVRRGAVDSPLLEALGVAVSEPLPGRVVRAGTWLVNRELWSAWLAQLESIVAPSGALFESGVPRAEVARLLRLPTPEILAALVDSSGEVEEVSGRVRARGRPPALRPDVAATVHQLTRMLLDQPFAAPDQPRLVALGLTRRELGAAAAAGAILLLPGEVVLLPDAPQRAAEALRMLEQPFTLSAARQALCTTRRVAVPLLEYLDGLRLTERVDGDLRRVRS